MNISRTREASSSPSEERRLSCLGASDNTGGGRDRDKRKDKTEQDIHGQWKMVMTLREKYDSLWIQPSSRERKAEFLTGMMLLIPPHVFLPLSSPAAAATHPSGFVQDVAPFDDDCISTSQTGVVAKGAATFSGNHLFSCSQLRARYVNTKLIVMSISSLIVQWVVFFHFSSLFAFPFITFINTSLSFPLRDLLTRWNQMMVALEL